MMPDEDHAPKHEQLMKSRGNRTLGLTLIELLVVIAIIGILAALLLPVLQQAKSQAVKVQCLSNLRQLQLGWEAYAQDFQDFIPGNHWQMEAGMNGFTRGPDNWTTGWLEPRQANNSDNTNTTLFTDPAWASLAPYTRSANLYRCPASRLTVQEGAGFYPLARTVSMNSFMGCLVLPPDPAFQVFHKISEVQRISPSDVLVFVDERDDSVDDGNFGIDMTGNQLVNYPSSAHRSSSPLTFVDGHVESHRWLTSDVLIPQEIGQETVKQQFTAVSAGNPDLGWLRAHATAP